jgi:hypothetical protein
MDRKSDVTGFYSELYTDNISKIAQGSSPFINLSRSRLKIFDQLAYLQEK